MAKPPSTDELLAGEAMLASGVKPPSPEELQGSSGEDNGVMSLLKQVGMFTPAAPLIALNEGVQNIAKDPRAAAAGFEQGASSGSADEVRGAGGALGMGPVEQTLSMIGPTAPVVWGARGVNELVDWALGKQKLPLKDRYTTARDADRAKNAELQARSPDSYTTGEVGAALIQAGVPVGGAATAAKGLLGAAKVAGKGVLTGGAFSGAAGLGASEADLTEGEFGQAAEDTLRGAAPGVVLGGLGSAVAGGASALAKKAASAAEQKAFTAFQPLARDLRAISKKAERAAIGRNALDKGYVRFGDTAEDIAERVEPEIAKARDKIKTALTTLDKAIPGGVNVDELADFLEKELLPHYALPDPKSQSVHNLLKAEIDKIRAYSKTPTPLTRPDGMGGKYIVKDAQENVVYDTAIPASGDINPSQAEEVKRGYARAANFNSPNAPEQQVALQQLTGALRQKIENIIESKAGAHPARQQWLEGKKEFGLLAPVERLAEDAALRMLRNQTVSLSDLTALNAAASVGGEGAGLPGLITNHLLKTRGTSSLAVTYDALSKILGQEEALKLLQQVSTKSMPNLVGGNL